MVDRLDTSALEVQPSSRVLHPPMALVKNASQEEGALFSPPPPPALPAEANAGSMAAQLTELGDLLTEFQLTVTRIESEAGVSHYQINQAIIFVVRNVTSKLIQLVTELQKEQAEENKDKGIGSIANDVLSGMMIAGDLLTGQYAMAAMQITLLTLQATGAIKDIRNDIRNSLMAHHPDMSKQEANLIADGVIVGLMVVSAVIAGGLASLGKKISSLASKVGDDVAESTAEEAQEVEMTAMNQVSQAAVTTEAQEAQSVTEEAEEESTQEASSAATQAISSTAKKRFLQLLVVLSQALLNTNFAADAGALAASDESSPKAKLAAQLGVELSLMLVAAIAGMAGMMKLASLEKTLTNEVKTVARTAQNFQAQNESQWLARSRKMLDQISSAIDTESSQFAKVRVRLFRIANAAQGAALGVKAGASSGEGATFVRQGKTTEKYGAVQGSISLFNTLLSLFDDQFRAYRQSSNNQLKNINQIIASLGDAYTKVGQRSAELRA